VCGSGRVRGSGGPMIPPRGMNDILPGDARRWQQREHVFRRTVDAYGYEELRTPVLEQKELFERSTGETSEAREAAVAGTHRGPRPHVRRAHWRNQAYGPKHSQHKLLWIHPTLVGVGG